jgi:hypothetical protein
MHVRGIMCGTYLSCIIRIPSNDRATRMQHLRVVSNIPRNAILYTCRTFPYNVVNSGLIYITSKKRPVLINYVSILIIFIFIRNDYVIQPVHNVYKYTYTCYPSPVGAPQEKGLTLIPTVFFYTTFYFFLCLFGYCVQPCTSSTGKVHVEPPACYRY